MKVYIAGPMSGIADFNFPAFHEAEETLKKMGYEVVSPAQHGIGGGDASNGAMGDDEWREFIRKDLKLLVDCDGIVLLKGWSESRGASLEYEVAWRMGLKLGAYVGGEVVWL